MISRYRLHLAWLALAALMVVFVVQYLSLQRDVQWNDAITDGQFEAAASHPGPRGALAAAVALHDDGDVDAALAAYGKIELDDDDALAAVRRYNLGLVWLSQAAARERADEADLGVPLIELAKQAWRDVLKSDPGDYDARYNLAQALQMLPEEDPIASDEEVMPERSPQAPQATRAIDRLP